MILEKAPQIGTDGILLSPGLRHQHHQCVGEIPARQDQQFQNIVQAGRVTALVVDDRKNLFQVIPEKIRGEILFPGLHLAQIASQGVDFSVVRQIAEGLGQFPGGKGVGAVALVNHGHGAGEVRILQVQIEMRHLTPQHKPLVQHHAGRQTRQIQFFAIG